MSPIERFFFDPIAKVRPFLFGRLFLLLLTIDMWVDFVVRGGQYDSGGFNTAHLDWMDAVQPAPSPAVYITLTMLVSFGSLLVALGRWNRAIVAGIFVLFTYAWTMSELDGYQHHYLMSLILLAMVFLPHIDAKELLDEAGPADDADGERTAPIDRLPATSAWSFVLLGTQVAIVYFWTAVTKMEPMWVSGDTVRRIVLTRPLTPDDGETGVIWSLMAVGGIIVELLLAAGYLVAMQQDRRFGRRTRLTALGVFVLAVSLHVGIEMMPLRIGLFSWYMLLISVTFLLPAAWLQRATVPVIRGVRAFASGLTRNLGRGDSSVVGFIAAAAVAGVLVAIGYAAQMPGAVVSAWVMAATLLLVCAWDAFRGDADAVRVRVLVSVAFIGLMSFEVFATNLRPAFEFALGRSRQLTGDTDAAKMHYVRALRFNPGDELGARVNMNYAILLESTGREEDAINRYRAAIRLAPDDPVAHYNLAGMLMRRQEHDEALKAYARAVELAPDDPAIRYDYAVALQGLERYEDAAEHYRRAADAGPDMFEPQNNAAVLLVSMGRSDEAVPYLRRAVAIRPDHVPSLNNLAMILATTDKQELLDPEEAVELAKRAVDLTERKSPMVMRTLGEAYYAAGHRDLAIAATELARELLRAQAPDHPLIDQLSGQIERFRAGGA